MPEERLPQRRRPDTSLTREEKRIVIAGLQGLRGPARTFVTDIARQAQEARGRLDDDVYGIVRATLEALAHNGGSPPPLVFAVTHHQTGEVKQVGFLPTGVSRMPRTGRFVTNDPRFGPAWVETLFVDVRPQITMNVLRIQWGTEPVEW